MIRLDEHPGSLRVRSRSTPRWALALLATCTALLLAFVWVASALVARVLELECDRVANRCRLLADDTEVGGITLAEGDRAEVRPLRGRRQLALVVTRPAAKPWQVVAGERPDRARRDAAELDRFLAGDGPARLSLRWDHTVELLLLQIGVPVLLLLPFAAIAYPMVCTVDRVSRRVRVRHLRERERPLDAFVSVRIQTGAEEVEERRRRVRERTGREPGLLGPRLMDRRRAAARRILLVLRDGGSLPVTTWLVEREDPGPVAERLRSFLFG